MLLGFVVVWIGSIVAAIGVGARLRWWLMWRLLLFVPLFAEIALFSPLGSPERPTTLRLLSEPNTWIWALIFLAYGVVLYGPSAIVLGGLGWMAVTASVLPSKLPKFSLILLGTLTGAVVGGCFEIVYRLAAGLGLRNLTALSTWCTAAAAGGAAGGFIVAYYAAEVLPRGAERGSSGRRSGPSV